MKIFITGATGFIGGHLIKRLSGTGYTLNCLVRNPAKAGEIVKLGATVIRGDVLDRESLRSGMAGCDAVINLANVYSFWERDRSVYTKVNVIGTRNVLECALELKVPKVIHVSSVAIYGKPEIVPFSEETPVGPERFSEYSRTKYEGDQIAWQLRKESGLPLVTILPCGVLGKGDDKATGRYISDFVRGKLPARVMEDALITFVHVADVAECIVRALEKPGNIGQKYIVGKEQLSFGQINRLISEIAGVRIPRMRLPDLLVQVNAVILTGVANLFGREPLWGLSTDQVRIMKYGFRADGSKAERDLGITYTPVRVAIEEMVATLGKG